MAVKVSALTEALVAAQKELPTAIERDAQGIGYRYTSLDKLIEATRPILTAHGIAVSQAPTYVERGESLVPVLRTVMACETEAGTERTQFDTPLYLTEKTMQGYGAAITYARRYAWAAALGIASEEDTDAARLPDDVPW